MDVWDGIGKEMGREPLRRRWDGIDNEKEMVGEPTLRRPIPPAARSTDHRRQVADVVGRGDIRVLFASASLDQAAEVFEYLGARVLPIWNGKGVIGVLPRTRLTDELARAPDPSQTVEGLACATQFCFDDDDLEAILEAMRQGNVTDIVVLNRANAIVGMLGTDAHHLALQ